MSEIKSRPYFFLTGKRATQNVKKTLVYGHVDILSTYQEAKIKMMILS